ncbi:MAG: histidine kinase dimerization/phosphoacceptor domain -containing protein [Melioribacteraceae bacterium]|nr:histidine kinase dimerization/phosphoacceptor domain -containing protein [Melioribacteraceae bacterium]
MKKKTSTLTTALNLDYNKKMWRSSITLKITMLAWGLSISSIVLIGVFNFFNQQKIILERMKIEASNVTEYIIQAHATSLFTDKYEAIIDFCSKLVASGSSIEFITVTKFDGNSLIFKHGSWHSESLQGSWVKPKDFFDGRITFTDIINKESYRYSKPVIYSGVNWGYVHLGISLDSYDDAIRNLIWRTVIFSISFIIFGFYISTIFSRRLTRSIKELVKTTKEIEAGNFKVQAKILSRDELGFLAHSFNLMTSAVSKSNDILEATVKERTLELGLTNKKLIEEVNERKKAQSVLRQYAARLETLEEIYKGIINAESTFEVFYNTIENIHKKIIQFTKASLCFFDNEKAIVKVNSYSYLNGQFIKTTNEYFSKEYSRPDKYAKDGYYLQNDLATVVQKTLIEKNLFDEGRKSYISFPLQYQNELIGELIFGFDEKMVIENEKLSTLVEVSNHVSVAIMQLNFEEKLKIHSEEMKHSLEEKEILLKEIHHRVKNNLQVISSLLSLQSMNIKDEANLSIFKDSQMRVRSIALVHEKLYQSTDLSRIDFAEYIKNLVSYIKDSYIMSSQNIAIIFEMDKIFLSIDKAVTLGLLLNELLSNAFKYAFPKMETPDDKKKFILIKFTTTEDSKLLLMVSDNGVGIPETHNIEASTSLGLKLVSNLISQINGKLTIKHKDNTEFAIVFDED